MCGIVGAVSDINIVPILIHGLKQLEYRGYDSCGIAVYGAQQQAGQGHGLQRLRTVNRVTELETLTQLASGEMQGMSGIAHTRWGTHGTPEIRNAHPHFSNGPGSNSLQTGNIAVVHNGIIENHAELRKYLRLNGYHFASETDSEVIAHLVDFSLKTDLLEAVQLACSHLKGAYALAIMCKHDPHRIVAARQGSPLVLGIGKNNKEIYLASDPVALTQVTNTIVYLEDGDFVDIKLGQYQIFNARGEAVERALQTVETLSRQVELGDYQHHMHKEIFEQPEAIKNTLGNIDNISPELFNSKWSRAVPGQARDIFSNIDSVLILACGTSYYSGCAAKFWLEGIAKLPTQVEVASEYRYRPSLPNPRTLVVVVSQSGETADTLAALRHAKQLGMTHSLGICNVASSSLVRECELSYITQAGIEVGVASTKAFTTQLSGLYLLAVVLAHARGNMTETQRVERRLELLSLPLALRQVLSLEPQIKQWAADLANKQNAIFLGRGAHFPIAQEGALKLKEISYIHADAYPAGELKHGPLALVTSDMPVIAIVPNDGLQEKMKSNLQEVRARGGQLYLLADADTQLDEDDSAKVIRLPRHSGYLSPLLHAIPLQLLAYHTACLKGTDVDKPRNLAKSVTVE